MRRLLFSFGLWLAGFGLRLVELTLRKVTSTEDRPMPTGPGKPARFPPAVTNEGVPLDFSAQPAEYQLLALAYMRDFAPMRREHARC